MFSSWIIKMLGVGLPGVGAWCRVLSTPTVQTGCLHSYRVLHTCIQRVLMPPICTPSCHFVYSTLVCVWDHSALMSIIPACLWNYEEHLFVPFFFKHWSYSTTKHNSYFCKSKCWLLTVGYDSLCCPAHHLPGSWWHHALKEWIAGCHAWGRGEEQAGDHQWGFLLGGFWKPLFLLEVFCWLK